MQSVTPQYAELLHLAQDLWEEAEAEHVDADHADCPACWKAHMANLLWCNVTGAYTPVNFYKAHRAAAAATAAVNASAPANFNNVYQLHRRRSLRAA